MRALLKVLWFFIVLLIVSSCMRPQEEMALIEHRAPSIPKKEEVIVIDAGHGGKDCGSANKSSGYEEKSLTLETALKTKEFLEEMGYTVIMTRENDEYIPLKKRAEIANEKNANLFVSIHYNHCPSREANGIEVFVYKEKTPHSNRIQESHHLAEQVSTHIVKYTGLHCRGTKLGNLAVVRETKMPAILVEGGFLSNPSEREKIKDPRHRANLAWGIARGIDHYFSLKKK
jgi:N-acetylmuramoyl-L-alanine amidase